MTDAHTTTLPHWQLAVAASVQERAVGYAGLKDRYAVIRQWFSIYLPNGKGKDPT